MKKICLFTVFLSVGLVLNAQNVGVGTTTPQEKLEIKNSLRSTVKISSNNFNDTTQLVLSNRNGSNEGTDFKISSIREQGLRISSASDFPENNIDPILLIRPTGQVGIGTNTPAEKLEIKNALRSTVKVSSNSFNDTTQLILSNRTGNSGTDFRITSPREEGLNISSSSDLPQNNVNSILTLTPTGQVGVRNPAPAEELDVTGNINVTGTIKANGTDGSAGQVLMKNNSGNLAWGNILSDFNNFTSFDLAGLGQTWVVPSGVTKIGMELWGGGGGGNNFAGGSGGGYAYGKVNVTPGETITIDVGFGGAGNSSAAAADGTESRVSRGGIQLRAFGGNGAEVNYAGSGGGTYLTNAGSLLISYLGKEGLPGSVTEEEFDESAPGTFVRKFRYGNGGDAGNAPGTGGKGGYRIINAATSASILNYNPAFITSAPGGGGAGGSTGRLGAKGLVRIYY